MNALFALRQNATKLDYAASHLPDDVRMEYRAAAAAQREACTLVAAALNAALDALYCHKHTELPAGDRRAANTRLLRAVRTAAGLEPRR